MIVSTKKAIALQACLDETVNAVKVNESMRTEELCNGFEAKYGLNFAVKQAEQNKNHWEGFRSSEIGVGRKTGHRCYGQ